MQHTCCMYFQGFYLKFRNTSLTHHAAIFYTMYSITNWEHELVMLNGCADTPFCQTIWHITSFLYPSPDDGVTWRDANSSHWIAPGCNEQAKPQHAAPETTCTKPRATFNSTVTGHNIQYSGRYPWPQWFIGLLAASQWRTLQTNQEYYDTMWDLRFYRQCCSGMWRCATMWPVRNISSGYNGVIFKDWVVFLRILDPGDDGKTCEMSGTTHTRHSIVFQDTWILL